MRYLVLSDIHGNLEALDACLEDARRRGFDRALVLGDLVGYGADPNAVIERVQELGPLAIVRGNHDKVAAGLESPEGFNAVAKSAVRWTWSALTPQNRAWLAAVPRGPILVDAVVEICHGSPFDEDAYIFDELDALRALKVSERRLCLFGHTHCPIAFHLSGGAIDSVGPSSEGATRLLLDDASKYLVNPGAVGQPRDGNPRAAYAIVDATALSVEMYRLGYAVNTAQTKIISAGLPDVLAQRLAVGR